MTFPSKILIIRHAEKPDDNDDVHLTDQGHRRADALVGLFSSANGGGRFPRIDFIFAAKNSHHSHRSIETVTPLANALQLEIHHGQEDDEFKELASKLLDDAKYQDKVILICWHHGTIPELARKLGAKAKQLPKRHWPDRSFDPIWVLDYDQNGRVQIHSEPQGLNI